MAKLSLFVPYVSLVELPLSKGSLRQLQVHFFHRRGRMKNNKHSSTVRIEKYLV